MVPQGCPNGAQGSQKGTQGVQKGASKSPKKQVCVPKATLSSSLPILPVLPVLLILPILPILPILNHQLTGGAGGRGEALGYFLLNQRQQFRGLPPLS